MASIRDVAARAGVSIATVSAVINNSKHVSQRLRSRVLKAIEELDYCPNLHARALFTGRSSLLAALVPSVSDPFFSDVLDHIEELAYKSNYSLLICNTRGTPERVEFYRDRLSAIQIDGVFVSLTSEVIHESNIIDHFMTRKIPIVGFGGLQVRADIDCIVTDDINGARNAAKYLLSLNHRQIAYIGPAHSASSNRRLQGVLETLESEGIPHNSELIVYANGYLQESAEKAALELISRGCPFTAVVCFNDLFALGVTNILLDQGFNVPQDISIIGFDDTISGIYRPRISTMSINRQQLAQLVIDRLLQQIHEPDKHTPQVISLPEKLIIRESTRRIPQD